MIRDITIGQYYPQHSPIHKIDARVKILITFLFIITLFFVNTFTGYAFVIVCLTAVIRASKVPLKFMLKGIKGIFIIIVFTAFINVFMTKGEHTLFQWGVFTVTLEGILLAIKMCVRLILLIIGSSLLTLTTTPIQLTDGMEYLLRPFKKIGVPAHEIAMMMTIALRFIPTLLDETDKIMKAQQARGADFDTGNLIQRAKSLIPIPRHRCRSPHPPCGLCRPRSSTHRPRWRCSLPHPQGWSARPWPDPGQRSASPWPRW